MHPPDDAGQPWSRQARESDVQWAWFVTYRDAAYPDGLDGTFRPRSLRELAESLGHEHGRLAGCAESFAWAWRAHAYDRMVDERRVGAELTEVDRQRAKHSRTWGTLWEGLECEVAKLARMMEGEAPALTPQQLERLLTRATEMMRLLSGEHTAHVKVESEDYSGLTPEELATLRALRDKARA
jgi:hypothetical protein